MKFPGDYRFEIIATGDEILFGRVIDTNSSWIAKRAIELGARLRQITCVGDNMYDIGRVLKEALVRDIDLIIFTGGLGPSDDDVTVDAIGRAIHRQVQISRKALERIRAKCAELNVELTDRGKKMARILEGSSPIPNPVGMATGMILKEKGKTIISLPGVPDEMKSMFGFYVAPLIDKKTKSKFLAKRVVVQIVWKDFFPMYRSLVHDFSDIYLKNSTISPLTYEERLQVRRINVDIIVEATELKECKRKMEDFLKELKERVVASGGKLLLKNIRYIRSEDKN